jgi:hypothetical protein
MTEGQNGHQDINGKARKRSSFLKKRNTRMSYAERKTEILATQEEMSDLYHQDEDSPLFDMLDTMLFGKIHRIIKEAKSNTNTSSAFLSLTAYLYISVD